MIEIDKLQKIKWEKDTIYRVYEKEYDAFGWNELFRDCDRKKEMEIYEKTEFITAYEEGYLIKFSPYLLKIEKGTSYDAAVMTKNKEIQWINSCKIVLIDEFENTVFNNLRQLVGQAIEKENFMEVLEFIKILSTNKLIQTYVKDVIQGFNNGVLEQILRIIEELIDTNGDKEKLKIVIDKYEL